MVCCKMLENNGAYAAIELSGEEARKVERLILEDPKALKLTESYTRLLAFLGTMSRESPVPPPQSSFMPCVGRPMIFEPLNPTSPAPAKDVAKAGQEDTRKEAQKGKAQKEHKPEKDSGLI